MGVLRIGVCGLGTVGAEVVAQLQNIVSEKQIMARQIELVAVSARTKRDLENVEFVPNPLDLASREDIDLVVELIGGENNIAYDLVKTALENGKHVVSANKALLAKHGVELAKLAEAKGLALNYEAAIAAAVPIVKMLREVMCGEEIYELKGILNGTSNYVLCQMADLGIRLDECLAEAKFMGYAEADPSFDIDGTDAAQKLKLLISLAFGCELLEVPTKGIEKVEPLDMKLADDLSYAIRLIAHAKKTDKGINAGVEPVLVALGTKFAQSSSTNNMIGVLSKVRHLFVEGEGAGAKPTASSVIADIFDIARNHIVPVFGIPAPQLVLQKTVSDYDDVSPFYIRSFVEDRAGAIAAMTNIMAQSNISLSGINQPPIERNLKIENENLAPVVFITHPVTKTQINKAIKELGNLPQITTEVLAIKIET